MNLQNEQSLSEKESIGSQNGESTAANDSSLNTKNLTNLVEDQAQLVKELGLPKIWMSVA